MSAPQFTFRIGAGLYIDSDGMLRSGPDPGLPLYQPPNGVNFNPSAIAEVFKDISSALPQDERDDGGRSQAKLKRVGVPQEMIDLLVVVGTVASVASIVLIAVAVVLAILRFMGVFKDGPSLLEQLVEKRYLDLDRRLEGMQVVWRQQHIAAARNKLRNALIECNEFAEKVRYSKLTASEQGRELDKLLDSLRHVWVDAVRTLLDKSTWMSGFNVAQYDSIWPFLQSSLLYPKPCLYKMPLAPYDPNTPPLSAPARFHGAGEVVFDNRAMVPGAVFAVESYLAVIATAVPEYRSTGEFDEFLRSLAIDLEDLAETMRTESLARTVAHPGDFTTLSEDEVIVPPFGPDDARVAPSCKRFVVGAMDLRNHTDDYFGTLRQQAALAGDENPSRLGSLYLRWMPPATLVRERREMNPGAPPHYFYRITNPKECADAANVQAEKDYLEVLYGSGYFSLMHLVGTMRHLSTEPDRSQTVATEYFTKHEEFGVEKGVPIKSAPIPFSPEITALGERRLQRGRLSGWATTQAPGRNRSLRYRIVLRTLPSWGAGWIEPTYNGGYHRAYYVREEFPRGVDSHWIGNRLRVDVGQALDEKELVKEGTSSPELRSYEATEPLEITAHTFDWWVPRTDPLADPLKAERVRWLEVARLQPAMSSSDDWRSESESSIRRAPGAPRTMSGHGERPRRSHTPDFTVVDSATWYDDPRLREGQRRDVREQKVTIWWEVEWKADLIRIQLQSQPKDRCYTVFVVIEEQLIGSRQWLHTVIPFHADGHVTSVPKEFFERERQARDKAGRTMRRFLETYAESHRPVVPGPEPDPFLWSINPGDVHHPETLSRVLAVAEQRAPHLLREARAAAEAELAAEASLTARDNSRHDAGPPRA